jgi:fructuronate reductase
MPGMQGLDLDGYCAWLLQRFSNLALQHQSGQMVMDGSQNCRSAYSARCERGL